MAAPILWAPGIFGFFLQEKPRFRGGGAFWVLGAGGVPILFLCVRVFFFLTIVCDLPLQTTIARVLGEVPVSIATTIRSFLLHPKYRGKIEQQILSIPNKWTLRVWVANCC